MPYDRLKEHIDSIRDKRLNLEILFNSRNLDSLTAAAVDELVEMLDYSPSITIHGPFMDLSPGAVDVKVRQVTRDRFSRTFDIAETLRPRAVVLHSGYEKWKYDRNVGIWLENSLRLWPEFIRRASAIGTRIAIENIFEDEPSNLKALMDELGSGHFGICFDTGHFNLFSSRPLSLWLEAIGQHIIELHLHDNVGDQDAHLAIGEGNFDFRGLFDALKGRDVIYTIEAHSPEDLGKSIERLPGFF